MQHISDLIDKIKLPKAIFQMVEAHENIIEFECVSVIEPLEEVDHLTRLVNAAVRQYTNMKLSEEAAAFEVDRVRVIDKVYSEIQECHIRLWMIVNGKVEFRRTKIYKDLKFANSSKFRKETLELYLDAAKHGINWSTLDKKTEIKAIHKFIALKFQAMAEAECPR